MIEFSDILSLQHVFYTVETSNTKEINGNFVEVHPFIVLSNVLLRNVFLMLSILSCDVLVIFIHDLLS
jgi:hypothetical protein